MAARENQGLQIALIIFVMLTIVLSVTTYIFFDNWKKGKDELAGARNSLQTKTSEEAKAINERNELVVFLGHTPEEKHEEVKTKAHETLAKYALFSSKEVRDKIADFPKLATELANVIKAKDAENSGLNDKANKTEADMKTALDKLEGQKKALDGKLAELSKANTDEAAKYAAERTKWDEYKKNAEGAIQAKNAAVIAEADGRAGDSKKWTKEKADLLAVIAMQRKQLERLGDPQPTLTDGRVISVDEKTQIVYVNIGSADNLRRRVSFSVYDKSTNDTANAVKKGAIEIIEVIDAKHSKGRILENSVSDPILPGDLIESQLWYPGKTQKFALAGLIDFNDDRVSDSAALSDRIRASGGEVVAQVTERGLYTGQISSDTAFLILGKQPDERSDPKLIKAWNDINADAKRFAVPTITLDKFLEKIGYTPAPEQTGKPNNRVLNGGIPVPRDNPGEVANPNFRPRTPPAAGTNGAF